MPDLSNEPNVYESRAPDEFSAIFLVQYVLGRLNDDSGIDIDELYDFAVTFVDNYQPCDHARIAYLVNLAEVDD